VAGIKYERQKKTAADSAPKLEQKGQKSGRKKMLETNACLFDKKAKEDANFSLTHKSSRNKFFNFFSFLEERCTLVPKQ
jgi:hypothetical protein